MGVLSFFLFTSFTLFLLLFPFLRECLFFSLFLFHFFFLHFSLYIFLSLFYSLCLFTFQFRWLFCASASKTSDGVLQSFYYKSRGGGVCAMGNANY